MCTSAQGLPPSVGAAHTQTPQASAGTRAEGTGSACCQHAISTGPQSSTRLFPPSLSRPPTLRVLGCHLADRLGVINPPRTPPRRFPGGDATACGRCFFQPDAGVVFFQPEADVLVSAARGLPPHEPRRGPRAVPWSRCSLAHNHSVHAAVPSVRRPCLARSARRPSGALACRALRTVPSARRLGEHRHTHWWLGLVRAAAARGREDPATPVTRHGLVTWLDARGSW